MELRKEEKELIEGLLKKYPSNKQYAEITGPNELQILQSEYSGVAGVSYCGGNDGKNSDQPVDGIKRPTEKEALAHSKKVKALSDKIARYQRLVLLVDESIKVLSDEDRNIVWMFYVDRKQWKEIAEKVELSESQCRRRRSEGLYMMYIAMFGEDDPRKI